jgi:2-keto-4-pentenoate hydratase/2-oxohepta-3-ene-1,7-dioic acid hydratase in catechol pathway
MKLVSFGPRGAELPGVLVGHDLVLPLPPLLRELGVSRAGMTTVVGLLPLLRPLIDEAIEARDRCVDASRLRLGPPVPDPQKIVVCGVNYPSQVEEARTATRGIPPRRPPIALRPRTSLAGPYDPIVRPPEARELDYEAELAVVVGRAGRRVDRSEGWAYVAGFMCAQDLGAHDVIRGDTDLAPGYVQVTRGKGFDTFCPTGPWLVTLDELPDPADLHLELWVNGELRQDARTSELIVDVPGLIEWVSSSMTLAPGDILLTGTPAGCGIGFDPPRFLQHGDVLRTSISGLGTMENRVEDERIEDERQPA